MNDLGYKHNPADWRLFIDSSKTSLKAVLLHNGNSKLSIPVGHSTSRKETFNTMKVILEQLNYPKYIWKIGSDQKVVSLLLGLQLGYMKNMCFLCLWDSRHDSSHCAVKVWPPRKNSCVGTYNVKHQPLVDLNDVYLPLLHFKLGLMKNFVKAMDLHGEGFKYLKELFGAEKSDAKLKASIFVGPEIRKLMVDDGFQERLNTLELAAWKEFKLMVNNFLGNYRHNEYVDMLDNMLKAYENLRSRMSLKMYFLHSRLDFFPPNIVAVSDEQGERFHQDISVM